MASNVFDAQIKAVDAGFGSTMRAMMRGMREIIVAARGVSHASAEGAKHAAHAGNAAAHSLKHAAEGVKEAGKTAEAALHGVEKAEDRAEAHHLRYFRSLGAHVRLLHGHFGELNTSIGEVGSSLKEFLPALGALAAGGSLVGMFEMTHESAEAAIAFDALAIKIGVTANELAGLHWAAKESGVEIGSMDAGMTKLNKTIGMAAAGKGKDAAALFKHLGISLKDNAGHLRSSAELLPQLADAFQKTHDPAMRALMATTLFSKAGQDLLPMLMKGSEAIDEMTEAGKRFADLGTDEQREKLKEFGHVWGEMDAAAGGFKQALANELAPALQPIVEMARDWIMANREWIAQGLARRVTALSDALKGVDLKQIITDMAHFVDKTLALTKGHGELIAILGGTILVLGSPLASAAKNGAGAFMLLTNVIRGLTVAMMTNPFVLFATLAIVAGGLIYAKWDSIKEFMTQIVNQPWGQIWADSIHPFVLVFDGVKFVIEAVIGKVKDLMDALAALGRWSGLSSIGKLFGDGPAATAAAHHAAGPTMELARKQGELPPRNRYGMDRMDYNPTPANDLYRPGGPALENVAQKGEVHVKVDLTGAPPGTKVTTSSSGIATPPETNVGFSDPMVGYGY